MNSQEINSDQTRESIAQNSQTTRAQTESQYILFVLIFFSKTLNSTNLMRQSLTKKSRVMLELESPIARMAFVVNVTEIKRLITNLSNEVLSATV